MSWLAFQGPNPVLGHTHRLPRIWDDRTAWTEQLEGPDWMVQTQRDVPLKCNRLQQGSIMHRACVGLCCRPSSWRGQGQGAGPGASRPLVLGSYVHLCVHTHHHSPPTYVYMHWIHTYKHHIQIHTHTTTLLSERAHLCPQFAADLMVWGLRSCTHVAPNGPPHECWQEFRAGFNQTPPLPSA